jgi:hypothetical protein
MKQTKQKIYKVQKSKKFLWNAKKQNDLMAFDQTNKSK